MLVESVTVQLLFLLVIATGAPMSNDGYKQTQNLILNPVIMSALQNQSDEKLFSQMKEINSATDMSSKVFKKKSMEQEDLFFDTKLVTSVHVLPSTTPADVSIYKKPTIPWHLLEVDNEEYFMADWSTTQRPKPIEVKIQSVAGSWTR